MGAAQGLSVPTEPKDQPWATLKWAPHIRLTLNGLTSYLSRNHPHLYMTHHFPLGPYFKPISRPLDKLKTSPTSLQILLRTTHKSNLNQIILNSASPETKCNLKPHIWALKCKNEHPLGTKRVPQS